MSYLDEKFVYAWSTTNDPHDNPTSYRVVVYVASSHPARGDKDRIVIHTETSTSRDGNKDPIWEKTIDPNIAAIGLWAIGQGKGERFVLDGRTRTWKNLSLTGIYAKPLDSDSTKGE